MEEAIILATRSTTSMLDNMYQEWLEDKIRRQEARVDTFRPGGPIDLRAASDEIWKQQFRFTRDEVRRLANALDLPLNISTENGVSEPRITALAMLLRRLAFPIRLGDVEMMLGWERTRYSRISNETARLIFTRWNHLLRFDSRRLTPDKLKQYADVIAAAGAPTRNVWGFIDGTLRRIARPVRNQRIVYNGWKRIHALKWHSVITPDGLHVHVFGPVEGRRHDETLYRESGLAALLAQYSWDPNGSPLAIYGDPAYGLGQHLISPFRGSNLTEEESRFNTRMSKVREAVEWAFGDAVRQFAFLDFHKNLKALLQPVGLYYTVALLLSNAHTILHRPQVSQYFQCEPPSLEEYFRGEPPLDNIPPTPEDAYLYEIVDAEGTLGESEDEQSDDGM